MKKYLLLFMAGCSFLFSFSQDDTLVIRKNIRVFADSFANAYSKKDWKTYTGLTITSYIKKLGGEEGFIRYSKELLSEMPGSAVKEYKITGIMQLLKAPTNWQCVIQQKKVYEEDKLRLKNTSYLIGVSTDGIKWVFLDPHGERRNAKILLPELSDKLILPAEEDELEDMD